MDYARFSNSVAKNTSGPARQHRNLQSIAIVADGEDVRLGSPKWALPFSSVLAKFKRVDDARSMYNLR